MGWFDNWSSKPKSTGDPLKDLDPSLREFLAKESPVKYDTSNPPAPERPREITPPEIKETTAPKEESPKPLVPPESLYQDGRYAHLWKTFQPKAESEAEAKSDAEKIDDIVQGYKYRKAEIGRAALENCADVQWAQNECFTNASLKDTMTMCRDQTQALSRCYNMQAKFLKALGYLSTFDNRLNDEKIQMHADTLYHRMLEQEAVIEEARKAGKPIPKFPPIVSSPSTLPSEISENIKKLPKTSPKDLQPHIQELLKERLKGLPENERQVEEMAIIDELRAGEKLQERLGGVYSGSKLERAGRKEKGEETLFEKMVGVVVLGFGGSEKSKGDEKPKGDEKLKGGEKSKGDEK